MIGRGAVLALALVGACTPINGGAVEASWTVRTPDGRGSTCGCSQPHIAKIRFEVVALDADGKRGADVCAGKPSCVFDCDATGRTGATSFAIAPGSYHVSLVPVGDDGADLRAGMPPVDVPANPQRREIVNGQLAQLDNFLVQAGCAAACGGNDTTKICAR